MVKYLKQRLSPERGFAHFFHLSFVVVVPLLVFVFVRLDLVGMALAIILISKWRMLSVKPRYWLAHIRTNSIDIIVNLSILAFMVETESFVWQLFWVVIYEAWILFIKPGHKVLYVSAQAMLGQLAGLSAMFLVFPEAPLGVYVLGSALISYSAVRHFFASFDEPHAKIHSLVWAFLSANIVWVLSHWLIFVGYVAMPAIAISALGFSIAGLYYLHETDKLSPMFRKQIYGAIVLIMFLLVVWLLRHINFTQAEL